MLPAPRRRAWTILALACAAVGSGCSQFSSRQRVEESRRYIQALRSENDQLKDQMLVFRNQNQDFSERSVDDARRLTVQSDTIEGLRRSVHAYQAEHEELKTAFRELRDSLPSAVRAAMSDSGSRVALDSERAPKAADRVPEVGDETPPTPMAAPREERRKPVFTEHEPTVRPRDGWGPAPPNSRRDEPGLAPSP